VEIITHTNSDAKEWHQFHEQPQKDFYMIHYCMMSTADTHGQAKKYQYGDPRPGTKKEVTNPSRFHVGDEKRFFLLKELVLLLE
jgi:hypothetical protein